MSSEIEIIHSALNRSFFKLFLPDHLEEEFKKDWNATAADSFKANSAILTIAFFVILVLTISILDTELLEVWPIACGVIFFCLATVGVLVRVASLNKYYQIYTGALASLALTASSSIPYFMKGEVMSEITLVASIYCIVIVYTMTKLLFINAIAWCLISIVFSLYTLNYFSISFSWLTFNIHIIAAHIFGITLAYVIEHREKKLFLNSRMILLEKIELNKIKNKAEERSKVQGKVSKFLESLTSDQPIADLGLNVLNEMSKHVKFNVAAIYFIEKSSLIRFGAYALGSEKITTKSYNITETSLGAAIQNMEILVLKDIPANSLSIASGIGSAKVCSLLMVPIIFENRAIGGLELGAFDNFMDVDIEFFKGIKIGLGITLNSCKSKELSLS